MTLKPTYHFADGTSLIQAIDQEVSFDMINRDLQILSKWSNQSITATLSATENLSCRHKVITSIHLELSIQLCTWIMPHLTKLALINTLGSSCLTPCHEYIRQIGHLWKVNHMIPQNILENMYSTVGTWSPKTSQRTCILQLAVLDV